MNAESGARPTETPFSGKAASIHAMSPDATDLTSRIVEYEASSIDFNWLVFPLSVFGFRYVTLYL
jgi:hypothetical protein